MLSTFALIVGIAILILAGIVYGFVSEQRRRQSRSRLLKQWIGAQKDSPRIRYRKIHIRMPDR